MSLSVQTKIKLRIGYVADWICCGLDMLRNKIADWIRGVIILYPGYRPRFLRQFLTRESGILILV